MSRATDLRDPRVWPEDRHLAGSRLRRNDREAIIEGLADGVQADRPWLRYRGYSRSGTWHAGAVHPALSPGDVAESLYRARWRELTILDETGEEVGGILPATAPHNDTGRRVWWGGATS